MKTLVTGGAGFIGSNLVKYLLEKNYDVKVLDNLSTGYKRNLSGLDVEYIEGDIKNKRLVEDVTKDIRAIFHLAAHIGNVSSFENPQNDLENNVLGTINILEAAKINNVEIFVYSSSAAIYGEPVTMPIPENHPQNPDSPYGISKLSAERYVLFYGKHYDMRTVSLRYFNVYGKCQRYDKYGNVIPIFALNLLKRFPITIYGDGEQTRDFVNVKDVVHANYLAAISKSANVAYNVGSGSTIKIIKLAKIMQEIANISTPIQYAPHRKGEVKDCLANISKIREDLGFNPSVEMKSGLLEYLNWLLGENE